MQPNRLVYTLCLMGALSACSSSGQQDPLLEEAATYHRQATDIQAVLEPKIDQIDSLKAVYTAQKKPAAVVVSLDSLKKAFEDWEANLVEVPGMPHTHTHEHGHHSHQHADATLADLPAEQMRDLQRATLTSIKQIQVRLNELTPAPNP
ncbi:MULTISPECIES: hypothetical protein [Spirosoma]|nr:MULTISPECIES: hypothetical protein [Spirosoma]